MRTVRNNILFFLLLTGIVSRAQDSEVIRNYIAAYRNLAIEEMKRTGVPAAIKLAQGIHETSAGTSVLVLKSNNHFGIKCKTGWTGESVSHTDDRPHECFRKYEKPDQSYRDHSDFLKNSTRYADLFKLDPLDYQGWAYGLKKAGYATNPRYPQLIIKLIEDYHLQEYTLIALERAEMPTDELASTKIITASNTNTAADNSNVIPAVVKEEKPVQIVDQKIKQPAYPEVEFKINDTRVIYAKKGTSFLGIAQQYNVPLARLFEFNELKQAEILEKDQLIYLQRKRKTGNAEFHVVQAGETLHDIAQAEAIRLDALMEYNLLSADMNPAVGEQLYLRAKASATPKLAVK